MLHRDGFSAYHPWVSMLYFGLTIGFSMVFMHPVCLLISFSCGLLYYVYLYKRQSVGFVLRFVLPMLLLTAIINPAFNHQGHIILGYLPTGSPLTAESLLYGLAAGGMLGAVLLWFSCFGAVMTTDKLLCLFGRVLPSLSLLLSTTLGFVPKFKLRFDRVREAQAGLGRDTVNGSVIRRLRHALTCFSVVVTWSLENAIETADSMKSRGWGLKGRTAYRIYTLTERDAGAIVWLCFCGMYVLSGSLGGWLDWQYFPHMGGMLSEPMTISFLVVYASLCLTPVMIDWKEDRTWKSLRSKI